MSFLTPTHLDLVLISCLACWAVQKQEVTSLPYFILFILSSCFFFFAARCCWTHLPRAWLWCDASLCVLFFSIPHHSAPWPGSLTISRLLCPLACCWVHSVGRCWQEIQGFRGSARKVFVLLATSSGPSDRLPVTTTSAPSCGPPHPAPFSALGVHFCSLPFKPRSGGGSLLLTAWRHCTSEPPSNFQGCTFPTERSQAPQPACCLSSLIPRCCSMYQHNSSQTNVPHNALLHDFVLAWSSAHFLPVLAHFI